MKILIFSFGRYQAESVYPHKLLS